jgi:hypothetical protein
MLIDFFIVFVFAAAALTGLAFYREARRRLQLHPAVIVPAALAVVIAVVQFSGWIADLTFQLLETEGPNVKWFGAPIYLLFAFAWIAGALGLRARFADGTDPPRSPSDRTGGR